ESETRTPVVLVVRQLRAAAVLEVLNVALGVLPDIRKVLNDRQIRVDRLIQIVSGPEVVADAGVDGEILVDADVILEVAVVLLDRRGIAGESAVDQNAHHGRADDIVAQRVLAGGADGEVAAEG